MGEGHQATYTVISAKAASPAAWTTVNQEVATTTMMPEVLDSGPSVVVECVSVEDE